MGAKNQGHLELGTLRLAARRHLGSHGAHRLCWRHGVGPHPGRTAANRFDGGLLHFCWRGVFGVAMAPLACRVLAAAGVNKIEKQSLKPNHAAVRLMHEYTLGQASRLWCNIDQNDKATHESESWLQALGAAIKRGELSFKPKNASQQGAEKRNPDWFVYDAVSRSEAANEQQLQNQ
jgi:hypothetical protein